jgi:hypothetical protein
MKNRIRHDFDLGHFFGHKRGLLVEFLKFIINNNKLLYVIRLDGPQSVL